MGVIGTIIVIFVGLILLSVFAQVETENEIENKKKKDDLELRKKEKEFELELKRQAGLDPLYQEQSRKNKQYKIMVVCLIALIILMGGYFLFSKNNTAVEAGDGALSIAEEITDSSQEETLINQKNENLPERFTPSQSNNFEAQSNISQEVEPIVIQKEVTQQAVSNPFEGNKDDTNLSSSSQISVYEADAYIGENTTVCGEVSQISQTAKATYINFGGRYPKHKFSAVMWSNNTPPTSEGSNICISGLIESYKGTPQIVIRSPENQVSNH